MRSTTGNITNATDPVVLALGNEISALITVSGTYAGVAIAFEISDDDGTTYYPIEVASISDDDVVSTKSLTDDTEYGWTVNIIGATHLRVRPTSHTGGTAKVRISADDHEITDPSLSTGGGGGSSDTELGDAVAVGDNITPSDSPAVIGLTYLFDGTNWDRIRGDTTNGIDVDVTRLPALAAGTNNIGDVDVLTLPELPAGTNNIGDVDVLTLPTLPAGDNNIGNVDVVTLPSIPAGTNNIGDVDVLTVPADPFGANADAAVSAGATGSIQAKLRRISQDIGDTLVAAQIIDDWDESDRAKVNPIVGQAGVAGGSGTVSDSTQRVCIATDTSLPAGTNNIGDVDVLTLPALAAGTNNIGDVDVLTLPALPAGTNNIGDVDVLTVPADPFGANADAAVSAGATGSIQAKLRRISQDIGDTLVAAQIIDDWDESDRAKVNLIVGQAGVAAGAGTVDATTQRTTLASDDPAVTALQIIDDWDSSDACKVVGNVAHDDSDSGNPIKVGYKAIAHGSNPSAVAANDRTHGYANRHGIPFTIGGHPNIVTHAVRVLDSDNGQTDVAIVTVSTGTKIVVTRLVVHCDGSNSGPVNVKVGFGASTLTTPNTTTAGTGILLDLQGVPAGGGASTGDGSGIIGVGADGEDLRYTCEDPAGGGLTISFSYFTVES